jgi:Sulfatase-modifying factor enzyme 1
VKCKFIALALFVLFSQSATADPDWPEKLFNPAVRKDDIVLPMPCGGSMVFRKIEVPGGGFLDDYQMKLGGSNPDYAYSEYSRLSAIDGPFADGTSARYYLIAKYETTRLQYDALTAKTCPKPEIIGRLPVTAVTRVEADDFADRYSTWLIANAKKSLPKAGREIAFVRLPTETEWEFAARGGIAVSPPEFEEDTFPMPEGMSQYVAYAGSDSANGKLQLTGLLKPNPLGLYDMLGNAEEFVADQFQLDRVRRLHGRAGGDVVKGGSYLTPKDNIRSAYRVEFPPYTADGPRRSKSTGFRLVLTAPVLTTDTAVADARQAWEKLGKTAVGQTATPLSDPLDEIKALSAMADGDPVLKARIEALGGTIKAQLTSIQDERALAARELLHQGAWLGAEIGRDNGFLETLKETVSRWKADGSVGETSLRTAEANAVDQERRVGANLGRYAEMIHELVNYDDATLETQGEALGSELTQRGASYLNKFSQELLTEIKQYRSDQKVRSDDWLAGIMKAGAGK